MWELVKEITAGLFLIALMGYILFQMVMIKLYGELTLVEDNIWILYSEIVLLIGIIALSIERLIKDLSRRRRGK